MICRRVRDPVTEVVEIRRGAFCIDEAEGELYIDTGVYGVEGEHKVYDEYGRLRVILREVRNETMSGYCPAVTAALNALVPFTCGGVFPYKVERCISVEEKHAPGKAYILVVKFLDTGEYDIRPYIPSLRERGTDRESFQSWISDIVNKEKRESERKGARVVSNITPIVFDRFREPILPESFTDGRNWEPILNAIIREKRFTKN